MGRPTLGRPFILRILMTKSPTQWYPDNSGTATDDNDGDYLKTSSTEFLLLSTGGTDRLLLGSTVVTSKEPVTWSES